MKIDEFCKLLKDEFKEKEEIFPETKFKTLENYGSLSAVMLLQLVEDKFDVKINPRSFRSVHTVNDLIAAIGVDKFD